MKGNVHVLCSALRFLCSALRFVPKCALLGAAVLSAGKIVSSRPSRAGAGIARARPMATFDSPLRDGDDELVDEEHSEPRVSLGRASRSRIASWGRESGVPPPARSSTRAIAPPLLPKAEVTRPDLGVPSDRPRTLPRARLSTLPPVRTPPLRSDNGQPPVTPSACVPPPLVRRAAATQAREEMEPATDPSPPRRSVEPHVDVADSTAGSTNTWRWALSIGVAMVCAGLGTLLLLVRQPEVMLPKFDGAMRALASSLTAVVRPTVEAALAPSAPTAIPPEAPPNKEETAHRGPSKRHGSGVKDQRGGRLDKAAPAAPTSADSSPDSSSSASSRPGRFEPEGP